MLTAIIFSKETVSITIACIVGRVCYLKLASLLETVQTALNSVAL